jgi:signal peptidase I
MNRHIALTLAGLGLTLTILIVGYLGFMAADGAPIEAFDNVTHAMDSTLLAGDRFTVHLFRDDANVTIRRGELVAHNWPPDRSKRFVKRVVGLPGDTLAMVGGRLRLNNRLVPEPYAWLEDSTADPIAEEFRWQRAYLVGPSRNDSARYNPSRDNWGPIFVPPGMYFVLGDNRDNSLDSRYWGFLPAQDIFGEVRRIYFSRDAKGGVRWGRLGHRPR